MIKYTLYLAAAIITFIGLVMLAINTVIPGTIYVFMFCMYGAYKLIAYTNKKYSKKPAKW